MELRGLRQEGPKVKERKNLLISPHKSTACDVVQEAAVIKECDGEGRCLGL